MPTLSTQASFLDRKLQYSLLQLSSWPALPDLLLETAPQLTRICALLARKPSVGMLIPVILNIPPSVTYALLDTLYLKGHIQPVGGILMPEQVVPQAEPVPSPELSAATASFLGKAWLTLMAKK